MNRRVLHGFAAGALLIAPLSSALADDQAVDADAIAKAKDVLLEVSRTYSELPAMTDEQTMTYTMTGMPPQKMTMKLRLDRKSGAVSSDPPMIDLHIVDGFFYARFNGMDGAVKTELGDDPVAAIRTSLGMATAYMPPQVALRWSKGIEGAGEWFGFGLVKEPAIAGYGMVDGKDGSRLHEIVFRGADGVSTSRVHVDPKTKLLAAIVIDGRMEGMEETANVSIAFKPKVLDRLPEEIAIDLGDAETYATLDEMMTAGMAGGGMADLNPTVELGSAAPDFELVDQDGKTHTLAGYRGRILMLDWWGVW